MRPIMPLVSLPSSCGLAPPPPCLATNLATNLAKSSANISGQKRYALGSLREHVPAQCEATPIYTAIHAPMQHDRIVRAPPPMRRPPPKASGLWVRHPTHTQRHRHAPYAAGMPDIATTVCFGYIPPKRGRGGEGPQKNIIKTHYFDYTEVASNCASTYARREPNA